MLKSKSETVSSPKSQGSSTAVPLSALQAWYEINGRHDLVWRKSCDPWIILVSEIMLQQTPVARVEKVFDAFIDRFPNAEAMATSTLADVIRLWDRLGYPRRARNLYASSLIIRNDGWPRPEFYETLPGVGTYTASALRSLTSQSAAVNELNFASDVNISRVCSRMLGTTSKSRTTLFMMYKKISRGLNARDATLAVMDLGSLVCRKKGPSCRTCPLKSRCIAKGELPGEAVSRQKPYEGSFRQQRGDLLARLREKSVALADADPLVVASLLNEGFVRTTPKRVFLADDL